MANEQRTGASITVGVLVGLAMACIAGAGAGWVVKVRMRNAVRDWNLKPEVVAAVDLEPDTVITFDMISQRSVPERFTTASMVAPDSASYVVNTVLHAPLKAGDVLLWGEFDDTDCFLAVEAAARRYPASKDVATWLAGLRADRSRQVARP